MRSEQSHPARGVWPAALRALAVLGLSLVIFATPAIAAETRSIERLSTGPAGGNAHFSSGYDGASADGSRVFLSTAEALVAADADTEYDVYERRDGVTTLVSTGPDGGDGPHEASYASAALDGTRVFFQTTESLLAADTDSSRDLYERHGGTTTLVSTGPEGGNGPLWVEFAGASADGGHIFFQTEEALVAADTDSSRDLYERHDGTTTLVSTGPEGGTIGAFVQFDAVSADGSRVLFDTTAPLVAADKDSSRDVYERSGGVTSLLSTGPAGGDAAEPAGYTGSSDEGRRVYFFTSESLIAADTDEQYDVYERHGEALSLLTLGPEGGNGVLPAYFGGSSADGSRVFIETAESLVAGDEDGDYDVYERSDEELRLLSGGAASKDSENASTVGYSTDGTRVFIRTEEPLLAADTDATTDIYESHGGLIALISAGPGGGPFHAQYEGSSPDGTSVFLTTEEPLTADDEDDERRDVYVSTVDPPEPDVPDEPEDPDEPVVPDEPRPSDPSPQGADAPGPPSPQAGFRCAGRPATIIGTPGPDLLRGTGRRDVIAGFGGNDRILAFGGNDVICGGAGRDLARAGAGHDLVFGQGGPDVLLGQAGRDRLFGQAGLDRLFGSGGRDLLLGGPHRDVCRGGAGRDRQRRC